MLARRPQLAELGLFLLVVALPLVFTPFSASPFGDPKLVILVAGSLALWSAGLPIDRRLGLLAAVWVTATALSVITGVDPLRSLAARTGGGAGGLMLVLCCAAAIVAGAGIDGHLRERARRWFVASACVVSALGLTVRLAPDLLRDSVGLDTISFVGATMGNQLFAAALLAAAIAAAIGSDARLRDRMLVVTFLTLGAATFGERSSLVLPSIAVAVTLWRARQPRRITAALAATVGLILLGWQILDPYLPSRDSGVGAALAPLQGQATDADRAVVWRVTAGSVLERPLLGWGPGNTQVAYLANGTPADVEEASRGWVDAHDLFLETAVTSGLLGLLPLLALFGVVVARAWRTGPELAWTVGAAAALGAFALVEPLDLVLTPLLFLFSGMTAIRSRPPLVTATSMPAGRAPLAIARVAVTALLCAALLASLSMIAGATLERWGRAYGEAWAFRAALRIQPWRLSASEQLATQLALDGRAGDEQAAAEATRIMAGRVERFGWDPTVRIWAADVHTLLRDFAGAAAWRAAQVERFPADAALLSAELEDGSLLPTGTPAAMDGGQLSHPFSLLQIRESLWVLAYAPGDVPAAAPDRERPYG